MDFKLEKEQIEKEFNDLKVHVENWQKRLIELKWEWNFVDKKEKEYQKEQEDLSNIS